MVASKTASPSVRLRRQISVHEGRVPYAYPDSKGFLTIGVGHLIDRRRGGRLPEHIIDLLLEYDIEQAEKLLRSNLPWVQFLDPPRYAVFVDMCINLGIGSTKNATGLLGFKKMITAARRGDWATAAIECADEDYVADVGNRAIQLAEQLRTGEWQVE